MASSAQEDMDTSFESVVSTNQELRETIGKQLWPGISEKVKNCLITFFEKNEIGDEDPILVIEYTPQMEMVNNNPGAGVNRQLVIDALSRYAVNIGDLGHCFHFRTHDIMQRARINLSNVNIPNNIAWAFYLSPASVANLATMNIALPIHVITPTANTRMITFYSQAQARLTHDTFNFFES